MAKMILFSTFLGINAVDRSSWTSRAELAVEVEVKDITTFASGGFKENLSGLKSGNLAIGFKNDTAVSQLDELMWALFIAGTAVAFEVRGTSAVVGTSNPKYTGSLIVSSWSPVSGAPGDVNELSVTYPTTGVITRATA